MVWYSREDKKGVATSFSIHSERVFKTSAPSAPICSATTHCISARYKREQMEQMF